MIRSSLAPGALALLTAAGVFAAPANTPKTGAQPDNGHPIAHQGPGPSRDFPNLDSYYPEVAKRAGQQGTTVIHICVDTTGKLLEPPTVASSSGNNVIDAAAVNLATVGSGHYVPASENGVAVPGCGKFRIAFNLRGNAVLPVNDPRFPTISARILRLDAEFTRRMQELVGRLGAPPVQQISLDPGSPAAERAVRQYARSLDSLLDEFVGLAADFLDDVDYLAKSPDLPESERSVFAEVWPEQRAALAAESRELIGATRDIVRVMDELGDYIGFSAPRQLHTGAAVESQTPEQDPQIIAIKERAKSAMERLRNAMTSMGEGQPTLAH